MLTGDFSRVHLDFTAHLFQPGAAQIRCNISTVQLQHLSSGSILNSPSFFSSIISFRRATVKGTCTSSFGVSETFQKLWITFFSGGKVHVYVILYFLTITTSVNLKLILSCWMLKMAQKRVSPLLFGEVVILMFLQCTNWSTAFKNV